MRGTRRQFSPPAESRFARRENFYCLSFARPYAARLKSGANFDMNPELVRKALDRVLIPNVLTNLLSRRVRQLNSGNRPLLVVPPTMGAADIALLEIAEGKMNWDAPATPEAAEPPPKKRRKH